MNGSRSIFVILLAIAGLVLLWAVVTGRAASVWASLTGGTASAGTANTIGSTSGGGAVNATVANTSAQLTPPTLVSLPTSSNATLPIASSPTQNFSMASLPSLQSMGVSLPGGSSATTTANATNYNSLAAVNALPLFTNTVAASGGSTNTGLLSSLFGGTSIPSYIDLTPQPVSAGSSSTTNSDSSLLAQAANPVDTSFVSAPVSSVPVDNLSVPSLGGYTVLP